MNDKQLSWDISMRLLSTFAALLFCSLIGTARADVITTFNFRGLCAENDCAGTMKDGAYDGYALAELKLLNYTPNQPISKSNFVSFHYDGTNLLDPYTITAANASSIGGSMSPPFPAAEYFSISGLTSESKNVTTIEFTSYSYGYWCTGGNCEIPLDTGYSHTWDVAAAVPTSVPEPLTFALLAPAVLTVAAFRRR